ncbi:hypothetical protein IFM89_016090 [Coptis chinensis]|uniref:Uncharacterized protein n=1 Tax=Coptis chinensis TaxID=261450 RepID=A0A835INR8_9MAGN|nr:hypothetical protein IFM89_016090 [Coptis chinensis]
MFQVLAQTESLLRLPSWAEMEMEIDKESTKKEGEWQTHKKKYNKSKWMEQQLSPPPTRQRALWDELTTLGINVGPWVVVGNFNVVTMAIKRKGGCSPCQLAVNEFVEFINNNALVDSTNLGYKFSWCNKRIGNRRMLQKIDRMLVNQQWIDTAAGWKSKILKRKFSDHSPVVGSLTSIPKPTNIPFRFKRIWIKHEGLKDVVKQSWEEPLEDVPIRKVMKQTETPQVDTQIVEMGSVWEPETKERTGRGRIGAGLV